MKPVVGAVVLFAFCVLFAGGCSSKGRNLPLDKDLARQSLITFLDTWKAKQPVADLKNRTPSIVGLDDDWDVGKQLESYEIVNMDRDDGSNVYAVVKLNIQGANGETKTRQVTYIIGTSPVVSIFRD